MTTKERHSPNIPFKPYLIFPIKEHSRLTEGYIYSRAERSIHGNFWHKGIDIEAPYGAPVYAAASGFAVAGYHRYVLRNRDKTLRLYKGKPMGNGLGYFVQIFHPEEISNIQGGRITQYGHLSKISDEIAVKVTQPTRINHVYKVLNKFRTSRDPKKSAYKLEKSLQETERLIKKYPWVEKQYGYSFSESLEEKESYLYTREELKSLYKEGSPFVKWVNQGDYIGNVGISAVFYGDPNYNEGEIIEAGIPQPRNSWDEVHLHFEECIRNPSTGLKYENRDPFDIYRSIPAYNPDALMTSLFVDNPYK